MESQAQQIGSTGGTRIPVTFFAPVERLPIEIVHRQSASFSSDTIAELLLNSVLNYVFVLNAQRQIVFASRNVLDLAPGKQMADMVGKRPGEALGCIHASVCEGGCGTSEFCMQCGAVQAILSAVAGQRDVKECRLTRLINCREEAMDLMVMTTPITHDHASYIILSVADISHEKRRRVMERIFFHDVINLAGGADGLLEELASDAPKELRGDLELSHSVVHELLEEVEAHRDLLSAEREELVPHPMAANSNELLSQLAGVFSRHPQALERHVTVAPFSASQAFVTDPSLLRRVLGNLIKNALEASAEQETVTLGCEVIGNTLRFSVHNLAVMPREVQLQMFKRSFSTKGTGRGLGTYSVKLLTEKYLKGSVSFTSFAAQGTTFFVQLPLNLRNGSPAG